MQTRVTDYTSAGVQYIISFIKAKNKFKRAYLYTIFQLFFIFI